MRLSRKAALFGATFALASVFTLAACSDDGNDASADLSGYYAVVGFWTGGPGDTPVVGPANGTATLSNSTYDISIDASATNPTIVSEGNYTATQAGAFTQDGTTSIGGAAPFETQGTGTWVVSSGELTLDTTCSGARSVVVLEEAI
jgi:hypothetical protein